MHVLQDGMQLYKACNRKTWQGEDVDKVKAELSEHADLHYRHENTGESCLHAALRHGFIKTAQLLISHSADTQAADKEGRTPICHAQHADVINLLLNSYTDINCIDSAGNTLLHLAVLHGRGLLLSMLLQKQVSDNIQNTAGQTALDLAYSRGDTYSAAILRKEITVQKVG